MTLPSDDLLRTLRAEAKKGHIHQAEIKAKGWHVDGLCDHDEGAVYVNPAPSIAEIFLHELLHRRFPRWGEKRVDRTARHLLRCMSPRQVRWWAKQFQQTKTTLTTPVSAD